jgi:hypothetical protein
MCNLSPKQVVQEEEKKERICECTNGTCGYGKAIRQCLNCKKVYCRECSDGASWRGDFFACCGHVTYPIES